MNAPVDVTTISIETLRLILRPWRESDLEDLYAYAQAEGVGEMAGWRHHTSLTESRAILELFRKGKKTLAIQLRGNGKVIGSVGLELYSEDLPAPANLAGREVGYVLSRDFWGRGLMPEAVSAVIAYCFRTLQFDFLTCGHFAWNTQSRRVIEKCGFRFLREVQRETQCGTVEQCLEYILFRSEWEQAYV